MPKSWTVITHDSKNPKHNALKDAMNDILKKSDKGTLSIWIAIMAALKQAQLDEEHTIDSILEWSYQQGLFFLDQGHAMENPMAWLRLASFQRVRTLSKGAQPNLQPDLQPDLS